MSTPKVNWLPLPYLSAHFALHFHYARKGSDRLGHYASESLQRLALFHERMVEARLSCPSRLLRP